MARRKFLLKSRGRLCEHVADLNRRFEVEVRRLREEIVAARTLRGEVREAHAAGADDPEAPHAVEAAVELEQQENEQVKRLVAEAVRVSPKGRRVRELMERIEETEQRIKDMDAELASLSS